MVTKEQVKAYCEKFGLSYVEAPGAPLDDPEEWLDTVCAGFHGDPAFLGVGMFLCGPSEGGECRVVTAFCDGVRRMEDELTVFTSDDLFQAVVSGKPLHAV